MRIAHLPSSYLPDALGGTELYVSGLVESLVACAVESRVVVHGGQPSERDPAELIRLPALAPASRATLYTKQDDRDPPGFEAFLDRWKPDAVHFHAFTRGAGIGHSRLALSRGIPYLVTYHTPAQSCPRGTLMHRGSTNCDGRVAVRRCSECVLQGRGVPQLLSRLGSRSPIPSSLPDGPWVPVLALPSLQRRAKQTWHEFYSQATSVVACADFCRSVLAANEISSDRIRVLRQGLPGTSRTRKLRLPVRSDSGKPLRLGYFGRVNHDKGVDLAAESVTVLQQRGIVAQLDVAGPVADADQRWFDRLGKDHPGMNYIGVLHRSELPKWLVGLDLVVIPSRTQETGPLTLLEAWDHGTPVIGTGQGGIREFAMAAGQSRLLFGANSACEIADAVERAMQSECCEVRIRGVDELAAEYVKIYDTMVNERVAPTPTCA